MGLVQNPWFPCRPLVIVDLRRGRFDETKPVQQAQQDTRLSLGSIT